MDASTPVDDPDGGYFGVPQVASEGEAARAAAAVRYAGRRGLEAVDAIAALPDVDGLLLGPADLSSDLGCPADLDGPDLRAAGQRIAAAAERHGKTAAVHLARADQAAAYRELGFTMLSCTFESGLLGAGASAAAASRRT